MPPPDLQQIQNEIAQLKLIVNTHQHRGFDFSQSLRSQDWQQIGKTVISAAATSIRMDIPNKQYVKIVISWGAKSGASNDYLRFNNDSGANYTTTTGVSQSQIDIRNAANSALGGFSVIEVFNFSSTVKPVFIHTVNLITSAGTAISSYQLFASWVNTTAFLTRVDLVSSGAQTYPANSSILILSSKE